VIAEQSPAGQWITGFCAWPDGRRFRVLNILDGVSQERLGAIHGALISGKPVARDLDALAERRGTPGMIVSGNGPELTCRAIFAFAGERTIHGRCTERAKPQPNGYADPSAGSG
jgi:putative transposase